MACKNPCPDHTVCPDEGVQILAMCVVVGEIAHHLPDCDHFKENPNGWVSPNGKVLRCEGCEAAEARVKELEVVLLAVTDAAKISQQALAADVRLWADRAKGLVAENVALAAQVKAMREALEDCRRYFENATLNHQLPNGVDRAMVLIMGALAQSESAAEHRFAAMQRVVDAVGIELAKRGDEKDWWDVSAAYVDLATLGQEGA